MNLVSRSLCQPSSHFRVFMGCIVIDNKVNVQFFGNIGIDMPKKLEKLLMSMSLLTLLGKLT